MPPKKLPPKLPPKTPQQTPLQTPQQKPQQAPKQAPPQAPKQAPTQTPKQAPQQRLQQPPQQRPQQKPQQKPPSQSASSQKSSDTPTASISKPAIPEHEVKQSSSMSAQLALEAAKKAYELRQAAYGAGDPDAREEILAKAINKEIEAESFGKAAKYTRSGAFQGLAAGAGLGVIPGVTLGQLTGAIVGGLVSTVGALLGGGIGAAYGAISGPFWDLGQMASQGVRGIVGDFPNWEATSSQKKALEKMVLGAQQTKAPTREELEQIKDDDGGGSSEDYKQFARDLTSWLPSMPSMPSIPSKSSMPSIPSISSIPGLGRQSKPSTSPATGNTAPKSAASNQNKQPGASVNPREPTKPPVASPKATGQSLEAQRPQTASEDAAKAKPKKLDVRSRDGTPQPKQPPVRKVPPKLETRRSTTTAKVS